jgi:hypothetical protein
MDRRRLCDLTYLAPAEVILFYIGIRYAGRRPPVLRRNNGD